MEIKMTRGGMNTISFGVLHASDRSGVPLADEELSR
jgi:hypothetical protein